MRLTWKMEPHAKGLARVTQGTRGWILSLNGESIGCAVVKYDGWSRNEIGWYWVARRDDEPKVPLVNTSHAPSKTAEEAKAACEDYVRQHLGMPPRKRKS